MARVTDQIDDEVVVADSEEERPESPEVETEPKSKAAGKGGDDDEDGDDDDEEGGEEEYEIEAILDAKRGQFEAGKFAYLVKWKGYGPDHNSWVKEEDAGNARELIDTYWRIKKSAPKAKPSEAKARARESVGAKSSAGRKSMSKEMSPPVAASSGSKRGRGRPKKTASAMSDEDENAAVEVDELEDDDDDGPKPKKKRASTNGKQENGKGKRKSLTALSKGADGDGDVVMDRASAEVEGEGEPRFTTMKSLKYFSQKNWEDLVKTISTVERVNEDLVVYFELTTGELVRELSSLCAQRFPLKLIEFYESHLRWRMAE